MSDPIDLPPDDHRLLSRLGELLRDTDPPPAALTEAARRCFLLRTLDAELAALVEDSADDHEAVAVRGDDTDPRQLTFVYDNVIVAVQVEVREGRRRLTGHLAPQGPAHIVVRQPAVPEARDVDADRRGLFVVDDVLPGPTSLVCHRPGVFHVATEWTLI